MNPETIRGLVGADPFRPFTLRLADGRLIKVPHRSFITISTDGKSFTLFGSGATDTIETILLANAEVEGAKV